MIDYKVSVIVPVYNGAGFISSCCEQLVNQTLKDIQIIFVNDGSVDDSQNTIEECAAKYYNVLALYQEKQGVSAARNIGIRYAEGEYVGFVDVDDEVDLDMFQALYDFAKESAVDVVCMDSVGKTGEKTFFKEKKEWMSALLNEDINMSSCNKLFKKTLLQGKTFPEGKRIHEDLCAVYKVLSNAESVAVYNLNKYHYIRREGSSSRSKIFVEKYFDAIDIADWLYDDALERFPELSDYIEARKAKTYLRISKIYYLRKAPKKFRCRILEMKRYLKSLEKSKLKIYFIPNDIIRYLLYIYAMPLFLILIKTIDTN